MTEITYEVPLDTIVIMVIAAMMWQIVMNLIYGWTGQTPKDKFDAVNIIIQQLTDSLDVLIPRFKYYGESLNVSKDPRSQQPPTPTAKTISKIGHVCDNAEGCELVDELSSEVGKYVSMLEPKIEQNKYDLQAIKRHLGINDDENDAKELEKNHEEEDDEPEIPSGTTAEG